MNATETADLLRPVLSELAEVVDAVQPEQLGDPTPCTDYDVQTLRDHAVSWLTVFASGYADENGAAPMELLTDFTTPAAAGSAVHAAADQLDQAVRAGAADRPLSLGGSAMPGDLALSMILWEYLVHGWDLSTAIGRAWQPDRAAAAAALDFAPGMLSADYQGAGKAFGPPVPVPEDAGELERLLGLSGRDPAWRPTK